jgi:hypothetical protein
MDIENVKKQYEEHLMQLPNVVGVGIGEKAGEPIITVFVTHKVPESSLQPQEIIPRTLDGHKTDVVEIGNVTAQATQRR